MPSKRLSSIRARRVAFAVLDNLANGQAPNVKGESIKLGYSPSTANQISSKDEFKEVMAVADKHAVELMDTIREHALKLMLKKEKAATYRDHTYTVDILTKNKQLLTGGATENIANRGSIVMLPGADIIPNQEEK